MHFLIFSNLSGCTVQNIQRTKKRKFNHSVKLAVSWDNYPWEVSVTFPPLCPLGYGSNSVGQQRLLVDVSSEGFSSRRDSEMLWLVAVSSLSHLPFSHWKNLCLDFLFWGREQGLAKMGPSMWALGSQEVLMQLQWSETCTVAAWKGGHPHVSPTADPKSMLCCGSPSPGQQGF